MASWRLHCVRRRRDPAEPRARAVARVLLAICAGIAYVSAAAPHAVTQTAAASGNTSAAASPAGPETFESQEDCRNPLFQTHWAGKSDIRHLSAEPAVRFELRLCPAYNGRRSCCTAAFEAVQQRAFDRWVAHWKAKASHIQSVQMDMAEVKMSQEHAKADEITRALFDKALQSFGPVLFNYGNCFDTLLEYMAGMLCFSCDPHWRQKVLMGPPDQGDYVSHLRVHESSNADLWETCRNVGAASVELQTRMADSTLAKSTRTGFEDLSMFASKIAVATYMADNGLRPLRGPNKEVLAVQSGDASHRMLATATTISGGSYVYPVHDGRVSGFASAVFPRTPLGPTAGGLRAAAGCAYLPLVATSLMAGLVRGVLP